MQLLLLGVAGLYDGPMGCAMKAHMINLWRQHFILEENMPVPYSLLILSYELGSRREICRLYGERCGDWRFPCRPSAESLEKLIADPKCEADKKAEYEEVIRQVLYVHELNVTWVTATLYNFLFTALTTT